MTDFASFHAHYDNSFHEYLDKSGDREASVKSLQQHLPSAIKKLQTSKTYNEFNVLSIGSGTGDVDQEILKVILDQLQQRDVKILNCAVDPSGHSLAKYKESIQHLPEVLRGIQFEFHTSTLDEYIQEHGDMTKFDLIHFIHSIYFVELEPALVHCYENLLTDQGVIACVIETAEHPMYPIARLLNRQGKKQTSSWCTAVDFEEVAAKHKWNYNTFSMEFSVDITQVFNADSKEGNLLLDFLTDTVEFRKKFDEKRENEVLQKLTDVSHVSDGRRLAKGVDHLVLLYKK